MKEAARGRPPILERGPLGPWERRRGKLVHDRPHPGHPDRRALHLAVRAVLDYLVARGRLLPEQLPGLEPTDLLAGWGGLSDLAVRLGADPRAVSLDRGSGARA